MQQNGTSMIIKLSILVLIAMFGSQFSAVLAHAGAKLVVPTQFPTIQAAVDFAAPGDRIKVLPGTFTEQVAIDKDLTLEGSGAGSSIIQAPTTLTPFEVTLTGIPRSALVLITNGAHVTMSGFTVSGPLTGICNPARPSSALQFAFGITVVNGATLKLRDSHVTRIRDNPLGRCFSGFAIGIGTPPFELAQGSVEAAHATISHVTVDDYQRLGIGITGAGSTGTVSENSVTGAGPTTATVQSGIVVTFGAVAKVTENRVTGNICNRPFVCGPDYLSQTQGVGIITGEANPGTIISENEALNNDIGIDVEGASACCRISENVLTNNRFFGITLLDGNYTTSENVISGGNVGIAVVAINVDTVGVLKEDVITATTVAPVQELSCCGATATAIIQTE